MSRGETGQPPAPRARCWKREGLVVAHKKRLRTAPDTDPLPHADTASVDYPTVTKVCSPGSL